MIEQTVDVDVVCAVYSWTGNAVVHHLDVVDRRRAFT